MQHLAVQTIILIYLIEVILPKTQEVGINYSHIPDEAFSHITYLRSFKKKVAKLRLKSRT